MKTKQIIDLTILIFIIIVIVLLSVSYYRKLYIHALFTMYDIKTLGGQLWKMDPEYGSYMKTGFDTPIPLKYYKEFNYAIEDRIKSCNNNSNIEKVKEVCDSMLQYIKENNIPKAKAKPLPIIYMDQEDCKEKISQYVDEAMPFVLRNTNLDVFNNMKFDKLYDKFKEKKVLFSPSLPDCVEKKVDFFSKIKENKCYMSNVTNIFNENNDLLTNEDISKLSEKCNGVIDSKQLFVGVTKGSGTKLHSAYTNNFFINIEGEKTWTFFNPNNTPLLYPFFSESGVYYTSECRFLNFDVSDMSKFPLTEYCDHYEYTIKPGEILYNPASWWHAVYNKTETTVAISTRWSFPDHYYKMFDYHLLRCGNLMNNGLRSLAEKLYVEYGIIGISQLDEHNILGNDDGESTIPVWDKITNENHNLCLDEPCHLKWHSN